jgi:very-short-patch-repair endonuclease
LLVTEQRPGIKADPVVEKLHCLLDYVEQVVRLDERPAFRLAEHRLSTGQRLVLHEHELHALPGVRHDLTDEEGPIWLAVERLRRGEPPALPEQVTEWLDASPDPDAAPRLREERLVAVPAREKDALVAKGEARPEDCAASLDRKAKGQFDVRLRLEDRPVIRLAAEAYIAEKWLPWAEAERPRRRSMSIYQKLFEIAQLADLVADQPFELVWGVGVTRWKKDGYEVDLPLVERLIEIDIGEDPAGEIRIRPRVAPSHINLRPYEEMGVDGAMLAADAAKRAIAAAGEDGVSPFVKESFEPALRACQSRLDPEGRYLPDQVALEPTASLPAAAEHLTVSDRWVLFARRRSENFLLADLANLKESVEKKAQLNELAGPARTLVMGPQESPDGGWQPLSAGIGQTDHGAADDGQAEPEPDLFFPKPFNDEQIEIVRRLEKTDGIVVQGPPGTGKTHTIANIVCHYLATGRRVLVVSHGEPALAVLRAQMPESVRDLAISITATEREGFKQLETAVRLLQSIVEAIRPSEQARVIKDVEASILRMRERLAALDAEIAGLAAAQLAEVPGFSKSPSELAKFVAGSRERFAWFTDRPSNASRTAPSDEQIATLRAARIALGGRLEHLDAVLPSVHDLPDGETVAALHEDLVRASQFNERAGQDRTVTIRIRTPEALEQAGRAAEALQTLRRARKQVDNCPWLERAAVEVLRGQHTGPTQALFAFLADAETVLGEQARYLTRPVEVPDSFPHNDDTVRLISRLAEGEDVFGFFAFKERSLRRAIESLRVLGMAPGTPAEWAHVRDHLGWRERLWALEQRWAVLATEIGAPLDASSTRALQDLLDILQPVLLYAPRAVAALEEAFRETVVGTQDPRSLWFDGDRLLRVEEALRNAAAATRLAAAETEIARLISLLPAESGKLGKLARDFLRQAVGRAGVDAERAASLWDDIREGIADLAKHRDDFEAVATTSDLIAAAGAPTWAQWLSTEPAGDAADGLMPPDWREAWDWAAAEAYLRRIDDRGRLQALSNERIGLDREIALSFERLVRERTFYALAGSMTGPIRSALMMFATALRKIGKGTGKSAVRYRRDARAAMAQCYGAIPCWIMPSWRVAEQLPGELGSFDLVVMDEASQSDIREVTALLRGRKVLVVGDDKQVSPTAAFIEDAKIQRLEHGFLKGQHFKSLLLPGSSLYDLAKVMFPDKFVMLKEHFRCVEPIIRFSMQFYPEPLIPLRVPTAHERLDPPLVDIYVPDGRRDRSKINPREAQVIVGEIKALVNDDALRRIQGQNQWRTVGVISLIGAAQAALINRMLIEELGEEVMLRHRIVCGDSAILQGNERDIVFLSMVADPVMKQAQTAAHFEQRFNVALSRARDRLVLVRSVNEDQLNPNDLKANVIRHFREPMAGAAQPTGDLDQRCESGFEREVFRRLTDRGYRVTPQVGSMGYRIDLVVEGSGDRRLAVECDGDKYHGPERWADDMRRQRILERVGWRFWRCWASSFTLDPDACMEDLFATLSAMGIEPASGESTSNVFTLHRTILRPVAHPDLPSGVSHAIAGGSEKPSGTGALAGGGIRVGDRIVVRYLDENKSASLTLSNDRDDPLNGIIASTSPLGRELVGANEEDEVEFTAGDGMRRVLIVRTERLSAVQ